MINRLLVAVLLAPAAVQAQEADTTITISWGAFVDTYYAHRFEVAAPGDVPYLTQPVRNNEANVNLAFAEVKLSGNRLRGRLALQAGTSVQSNYSAEPTIGSVNGPSLSRHIQEAAAGYQVASTLWVDAGIYLSHIGSESWISRDNWTYTRSLIAEWSPYYESGIKATWSPSSKVTVLGTVLNGWQNISETNSDKAVGARIDFIPIPNLTLSYSNFIGNELNDSVPSHTRILHDASIKFLPIQKLGFLVTFDLGDQADSDWWGWVGIVRFLPNEKIAIVGRVEQYQDEDGVLINTGTPNGFKATAFSLGVDFIPKSRFLWRTEFRTFKAPNLIFPEENTFSKTQGFLVSSFALTI